MKEDEASKAQLFLVEEILEGYQELLEAHEFQANYNISSRTFRYWVTRGLFYAPLRRKFNQALYPAKTILELLAVRILQGEFNLSLEQIKLLFKTLPISYWEGVSGIKRDQKEVQFQEAIIRDPNSLTTAKGMLLSCSGVEEQRKWWREYLGVETDEEASEMRADMVRAWGWEIMETPKAEPYMEHIEYLRRHHKENLKQLTAVFKRYNEEKYHQYLNMEEGQLLKEALKANDRLTEEEELVTLIQKFEAQLKIYFIKIVITVKKNGLSLTKTLEAINEYKKAVYQLAVAELKKKRIESEFKVKYILKHDLNIKGKKSDSEEILFNYPYSIVTLDYGDEKVVAVIKGDLEDSDKLLDKRVIPADWYKKYDRDEQFFKRMRIFQEKWASALEKTRDKEAPEE